jgi:serine/threonine-protein kinase HipA
VPSLNVWMNGELVGEWAVVRSGTSVLRYAESWVESPRARALSLSLPLTADREVRGPAVDHYFDNLLPDNADIRRRIRERFNLRTMQAFDLLEAIGRDCVGAVQLLPLSREPVGWNHINVQPLSETGVEKLLRSVTAPPPLGARDDASDESFRISIAGAQEKTALLSMAGAWFRPLGATPTTHILKLPLGIIGNFRGDFSESVENEWLCARLLREFGIPVADTQIATFGSQKALVVTRFDRRWIGVASDAVGQKGFVPPKEVWIARLPQEDFCQATGRPPTQRYESDRGPGIDEILGILANSEQPDRDRTNFVLAQFAFSLFAATDGHGKNFSIHHHVGGKFELTPLYDVLSAWPIIGKGAHRLQIQDAKLAMALPGRTRHYRIKDIQARHWHALAQRTGITGLWAGMLNFVESAEDVIRRVERDLPNNFPERVFGKITNGLRRQAQNFLKFAPPR